MRVGESVDRAVLANWPRGISISPVREMNYSELGMYVCTYVSCTYGHTGRQRSAVATRSVFFFFHFRLSK